ncbi:gluconeogenesis factor YvcK family protein [Pseudogracilibacillus auburnensis]|uniref:gluconeogenesis factor YvcK family protein n=1 Tax=Pseudogracilibacillus auburnensis TaxID=1494959 RepID=UPI001A957A8F|nr:YvcK family protein [Pseudogracilibacillus auburnensis]MBO1001575.1 YvcK family protein [Pseudogracilibacillus auburnensis]
MSCSIEPKIVVLGGGTGMPVLLRGLKKYPIELSTIVTVADDGGSTGRLRKDIEIPAPGDIRNVIAALSNVDAELKELFQHRFQVSNGLSGHSLGNLVLVAMNALTGDFYSAVKKVSDLFQVKGNIYPIVNESVTLHAEMDDGMIVSGESNIPMKNKKIKRVFLTPNNLEPMPKVVQAILEADMIVISPGSLYTSILPNLIIADVVKALNDTKAKVVYVCNVMTQDGETNNYHASDHVQAIYNHIGPNTIDSIIVHNQPIPEATLQLYARQHSAPVIYQKENLLQLGLQVMEEDIIDHSQTVIRHNTNKIAKLLYDLAINKKR